MQNSFSDNERLIGNAAKNQVAMNPHNTYVDLSLHGLTYSNINI